MYKYLWARQSITLNNIANVDTPGFKAQYITFEEELAKRLKNASAYRKAPKHAVAQAIEDSRAQMHITWDESSRLDGNNVDMDQEQIEVVRTAYEYQYMLSSLNNDFTRLKSAAKTF